MAVRLFGLRDAALTNALRDFKRWFITVSINEELRGKPDHITARLIREFERTITAGDVVKTFVALRAPDLAERRLIRGKALTIGVLLLFAQRKSLDLRSGELVPPRHFLEGFGKESVNSVLNLGELATVLPRKPTSDRVASNVVVGSWAPLSRQELNSLLKRAFDEGDADARKIAESQFFNDEIAQALLHNDYSSFLTKRAEYILQFARDLTDKPHK